MHKNIDDTYIERIIVSDNSDVVVEILKTRHQKKEKVEIDVNGVQLCIRKSI